MTAMTEFHVTTVSHFGLLLWVWWVGGRKAIWQVAIAGAVFSVVMELAYYSPLVPVRVYEWLALEVSILATAIDFYVFFGLLFNLADCHVAGIAVVTAIFWHQLVKLNWYQAADLFGVPTGVAAVFTPVRAVSSWLVLLAFAAMAYCDRCAGNRRTEEKTV